MLLLTEWLDRPVLILLIFATAKFRKLKRPYAQNTKQRDWSNVPYQSTGVFSPEELQVISDDHLKILKTCVKSKAAILRFNFHHLLLILFLIERKYDFLSRNLVAKFRLKNFWTVSSFMQTRTFNFMKMLQNHLPLIDVTIKFN